MELNKQPDYRGDLVKKIAKRLSVEPLPANVRYKSGVTWVCADETRYDVEDLVMALLNRLGI